MTHDASNGAAVSRARAIPTHEAEPNALGSADRANRLRITSERLKVAVAASGERVDQYGRTADECEATARLAASHAHATREALADVSSGVVALGMLGGHRQVNRLDAIASLFDRIASRDTEFANKLRAAGEAK
jgi:hypothetical protein